MTDLQQRILAFLASQKHCVISTVAGDGSPQSALVAFSEGPDFSIVIGTFNDTRKFTNLLVDARTSLVISGEDVSLQIEGTATLMEGADAERCTARHAAKNPAAAHYALDSRQRYFVVTPSWMRFTDRVGGQRAIEELRF